MDRAKVCPLSASPEAPSHNKSAVLSRLRHLQPFPPVVVALARMVTQEEVRFKEIARMVRSDAAVSAAVLRMANSPLLGCRRQVNNVLHAVAMLGLERLKGLVLTVTLRKFLSSMLEVPALMGCWRHNLACGFLCEELAAACFLPKDTCYTAGLLHDIGRLAFLAAFPSDYVRVLDLAERGHRNMLECEREVFGLDHCEAGQWLVEEWEFPEEFSAITGAHHQEPAWGSADKLTLVRLSCRMASALGFKVSVSEPSGAFPSLAAKLPARAWQRYSSEAKVSMSVAERINALECSLLG